MERGKTLTLLEEFLDSKPEKTKINYLAAVREFCRFVRGDDDLESFIADLERMPPKAREETVLKYVAEIKRKNAPMTVHFKLVPLRHLFELYDLEMHWKRVKMILPRKRVVKNDKPVTKDIVRKVLPLLSLRKRLVVWFLFVSGCRINEALDLKVKDFDLASDPPRVKVITEKSNIPRIVFLPRDFANEVKAWITKNKLEPGDYVFFSGLGPKHRLSAEKVRRPFQAALRRLNLLERDESGKGWNFTIHGFRDNYKTLLTSAGIQGLVVEALMGHDLGLDASYYKPTVEDLAKEWKKAEEYFIIDNIIDKEKLSIFEKQLLLRTLESVWNVLHPTQPPEELYQDAARFRLFHYPNDDEKIEIMQEAIRSFTAMTRQRGKVIEEVIKAGAKRKK
jgi:integrase